MSVEYAEKIHGLLSHEDIEVVQQELALLDSLVDSEADLLRTMVRRVLIAPRMQNWSFIFYWEENRINR